MSRSHLRTHSRVRVHVSPCARSPVLSETIIVFTLALASGVILDRLLFPDGEMWCSLGGLAGLAIGKIFTLAIADLQRLS